MEDTLSPSVNPNSDEVVSEGNTKPEKPWLWKPGQSGNPNGRPKGAKNKVTIIREYVEQELTEMLAEDAQAVLKVAIDRAKDGNDAMLKLLLDKLLPMRKAEDGNQKKSTPSITINVGRTGDGGVSVNETDQTNEEGKDGEE